MGSTWKVTWWLVCPTCQCVQSHKFNMAKQRTTTTQAHTGVTEWYRDRWKATTMGNSPNDAGHVIWALGECISFFPFIFIDSNACFLHIQLLIYILRDILTGGRLWRWEIAQMTTDMLFGPLVHVLRFYLLHLSILFLPWLLYLKHDSFTYWLIRAAESIMTPSISDSLQYDSYH